MSMDFLSNIVSSNFSNDLLQAGTAMASGKSAGDVAKHAVTRNQTRRLEEYFMKAAEAYSSGYSTFFALSTEKFGGGRNRCFGGVDNDVLGGAEKKSKSKPRRVGRPTVEGYRDRGKRRFLRGIFFGVDV